MADKNEAMNGEFVRNDVRSGFREGAIHRAAKHYAASQNLNASLMAAYEEGHAASQAEAQPEGDEGECECGHPKARHNFLDETQTSLDGCYPEDESDCDCNEFRRQK